MERFRTGINSTIKILTSKNYYISPIFSPSKPKILLKFYSYIYQFFTIFVLISILIFTHFLPFFFLTKNSTLYESDLTFLTQFFTLTFPHFLSLPLTKKYHTHKSDLKILTRSPFLYSPHSPSSFLNKNNPPYEFNLSLKNPDLKC